MKKIWLVILGLVLFSGCDIANTPTSRVENYLGSYQKIADGVPIVYTLITDDEDISEDNGKRYEELIKKQYKSMSYEIIEEEIDGEEATVTVQIKVYDYKEVLDRYNKRDYELGEYHNLIIEAMEKQRDKVTYTVEFELVKNGKDEWEVDELSPDTSEKLLGIN